MADDGTMDMDVGVHTTDGKSGRDASESANVKPNPWKNKRHPNLLKGGKPSRPKVEFTVPPPTLHVKPKMTTHLKHYPGGSIKPSGNKRG